MLLHSGAPMNRTQRIAVSLIVVVCLGALGWLLFAGSGDEESPPVATTTAPIPSTPTTTTTRTAPKPPDGETGVVRAGGMRLKLEPGTEAYLLDQKGLAQIDVRKANSRWVSITRQGLASGSLNDLVRLYSAPVPGTNYSPKLTRSKIRISKRNGALLVMRYPTLKKVDVLAISYLGPKSNVVIQASGPLSKAAALTARVRRTAGNLTVGPRG